MLLTRDFLSGWSALMAVVAGAGVSAVIDVQARRIPNAVTLATATTGLALAVMGLTEVSVASASLGFAMGLLLTLPGYLLGSTGAGDVKLFAALGTILGAERVLSAFLYTAIAGGVLAVGMALTRGQLMATARRALRLMRTPPAVGRESSSAAHRFPYGPAIATGSVLAML